MGEIKLTYLQGVETMVGILVRDGYEVTAKKICKKFPSEKETDYFLITYKKEYLNDNIRKDIAGD